MPTHDTVVHLLVGSYPATVTWDVESTDEGGIIEIEGVHSDLLGDITHHVVGSRQGFTYTDRVPDRGWQDPIRRVMFGQPTSYHPSDRRVRVEAQPYEVPGSWGRKRALMLQHEATRVRICCFPEQRQRIQDEIRETDAFEEAYQACYDREGYDF